MASYFGLLDLADGASGEEAVAKVVGKVVAPAEPKPPTKKTGPKDPAADRRRQQHVREEYRREDSVRGGRGRGQGPVGGRGRGNGQGYYNGNGNGGYYNGNSDRGYYNGNGDHGYYNGNGDHGYYNGNGNRGYYRSGYDQVYYDNNGQYHQDAYNGERQGYNRDGGQSRGKNLHYRPKEKLASDAASDAELKPEEKLEPAGETKKKETSADNVDGVPASESEKSTGDVAKDDSKKNQKDNKEKKSLSGSAKRKLKKQNLKKVDSKVDSSKKTTDKEPAIMEVIEEEKKEMTLEEYEKMLEEKKSLNPSKSEEREINAVAFEGLQLLEKKKVEDDAKYKLENGQENENDQRKGKEGAVKEVKARKAISIQEYLKPADGQEYVPPRPLRRDGFSNGSYNGAHGGLGNGGFSGRSGDNSTEPRVYNSGRGENATVFHNVDNGQARRDGYNGGYQDRRDGYNGGQQGVYNGGRGNGGYRQGGYSERSGSGGHRGYGGNGGHRGRGYPRGRPVAVPRPESAVDFPALTGAVPTPGQSQAPSSSPAPAKAQA